MRYDALEATQHLKLKGVEDELEFKRRQQQQEFEFRQTKSSVDRADLDHKL